MNINGTTITRVNGTEPNTEWRASLYKRHTSKDRPLLKKLQSLFSAGVKLSPSPFLTFVLHRQANRNIRDRRSLPSPTTLSHQGYRISDTIEPVLQLIDPSPFPSVCLSGHGTGTNYKTIRPFLFHGIFKAAWHTVTFSIHETTESVL